MPSKKSEQAPVPVMQDHLVIIDGNDYHILASDQADLEQKIAAIRADSISVPHADNGK